MQEYNFNLTMFNLTMCKFVFDYLFEQDKRREGRQPAVRGNKNFRQPVNKKLCLQRQASCVEFKNR